MRLSLACVVAFSAALPARGFNVRTDRPRILFSSGAGPGTTLAQFKQRCTSDPIYMKRCTNAFTNGGGSLAGSNAAAAYLVTGDAAHCSAAIAALKMNTDVPGQPDPHSFISNNGRTMEQLAEVRDWCDGALSNADQTWLEGRIVSFADWYVANGTTLDIWHDDDSNAWKAVALAGLALKGTAQDAKAMGYLTAADAQWKQVILPAMAYAGDWWHEGMVYVQVTIGSLATYALAWSTATDENLFAEAPAMWNDLFNGYLTFHAYAIRPDYNYVYFGDTSDNKQSIELFSRWLVDALTTGTGSALGQGLSIEIGQNSRPGYDYSGADGWLLALLYDATRDGQATPRAQLPTYHWHGKGAEDVAVLRSGWGAADTYAWLSCGDYFGAHQHDEVGAFQIFRHAILTGSDGYYDSFDSPHWSNYYSQHSVHANTLSVTAPGEFFPNTISLADKSKNVNDGGQRVLRRDDKGSAYPSPNLMQYMTEKNTGTQYETGTMQDVTQDACAGYVACDATAAYDSPGHVTNGNAAKVSEVTRQMVMLSADWFVIFDRVEATDPSYPKAFLLHTPGPPTVSGGDFSVDNGTGRLVGRALLPAAPTLTTVTNFTVAGMSYPPAQAGNESGGTRIEIAPSAAAARDYFLVVLGATDASTQRVPQTTVDDAPDAATLTLDDGTTKWVVRFPKSGPLGGHVTVTKGSQTVCDEALGGGGGGDGGMGGGDMAGQPGRDLAAGGGDGGGGGGMPGGCSCAVGGRSARGIGWVLVLGVVAVVGRPRPRLRPRVG